MVMQVLFQLKQQYWILILLHLLVVGGIFTTGDLTLDSTTDINLDAEGNDIVLLDNGTEFGRFTNDGTPSLVIDSAGTTTTIADDLTITGGDITNTTLNFGNGSAATLGTTSNSNLTIAPNGSGELTFTSDFDSGVNIGTSLNTPAPLSIEGGIGGNSALIVNQLNSGDILSASSSGVTRFRVTNTGELVIGDNTSSFFTTLNLQILLRIEALLYLMKTELFVYKDLLLVDSHWELTTSS